MISAWVDDAFVAHLSMRDIGCERPAYASAFAGIDKAVLRTGVEGIPFTIYTFTIYHLRADKLRVEHHITLLAEGLEIVQPLPVNEVFCAGYACGSRSGGGVVRFGLVMTLHTEDSVYPSVLMTREAHVIDVRCGCVIAVGHGDGFRPETPVVDAVGRLRYREEGLTVGSFHPCDDGVFAFKKDGSGIEHRVHHDALHQEGIVLLIEVIAPLQRRVLRRENRVLVFGIYSVSAFYGFIRTGEQRLMCSAESLYFIFIRHTYYFRFTDVRFLVGS